MREEILINHLEKYGNCFLGNKTIKRNNNIEKIVMDLNEKGIQCTYTRGINFPNNFIIQKLKKSTCDTK